MLYQTATSLREKERERDRVTWVGCIAGKEKDPTQTPKLCRRRNNNFRSHTHTHYRVTLKSYLIFILLKYLREYSTGVRTTHSHTQNNILKQYFPLRPTEKIILCHVVVIRSWYTSLRWGYIRTLKPSSWFFHFLKLFIIIQVLTTNLMGASKLNSFDNVRVLLY